MVNAKYDRWPHLAEAMRHPPRPRVLIANRSSGEQVRINVRSAVNAAKIRREKLNGRDVIIVPSATLPDDVVMNGSFGPVLYPADEIAKSFMGLERTPAPLGHPTINGRFVSARDPEGLNIGWIGAFNTNVRREKGKDGKHRVLLDKVIDVERASESEGGRRVLEAIEKGDPIHTSTGMLAVMEAANGDVDYKHIAREIEWDHDAILLDEQGAATPEQGVGMLVNAQGEQVELKVINSSLEDAFDQEIEWAGTRLIEAVRRKEDASKWQDMAGDLVGVIRKALGFNKSERSPSHNNQEIDVTDKAQFDALSAEVKTLSESMNKALADQAAAIGNAVTEALKPLVEGQQAIANAAKAKEEAELSGLRDKIVKANLLDEDAAKELTLNAARKLAEKAEPGDAAPLNPAFKLTTNQGGGLSAFKLPKAEAK